MQTINFNNDISYNDNKPAIKLMLETDSTKEIRILMKKGQSMKEHKTAYPIVVHVLSGKIDFNVENKLYEFSAGAAIGLDSNVPHSLFAQEDSMVRLSLAKQDSVKRVIGVVE